MAEQDNGTAAGNGAGGIYEGFRYLRENAPVSREGQGPWRVARYHDVQEVLRDPRRFSSRVSPRSRQPGVAPTMLFTDPPDHFRLRKLVAPTFAEERIREWQPLVEARCTGLMDDLLREPEPDLVGTFASPLPVAVIASILGVQDGDLRQFKYWSDTIFSNIGLLLMGGDGGNIPPEVAKAGEEMNRHFLERIRDLRRQDEDNLLGHLVRVETDQGKLSDEEIADTVHYFISLWPEEIFVEWEKRGGYE